MKDTKFVEITFKNLKSLVIGVVYRSPNAESALNHALNDLIEGLYSTTKDIILLGDWNYPEIDWAALKSNSSEYYPTTGFLHACSNASLVQKIGVPTRVKGVGAGNILDLVLTNNNNIVCKVTIDSPIGKSDHATILVI